MIRFDVGTIILVPFPLVDKKGRKNRPALMVSAQIVSDDVTVLWAVMITSAARARWAGDVDIPDHQAVGLPIASMVRTAKIATFDQREAAFIAMAPRETTDLVLARVRACI